ncbi:MAG TPA: S8 family serine peptidase [Flavipsychrobacter sp.]|nr:S8 family serine peptidase [Flavipsychrobacter sp.]
MKRNFTCIFSIPIVSAFLCLFLLSQPCAAQQKQSPYLISLKSGNVELPVNAKQFIDSIDAGKPPRKMQLVVQFYTLPDNAEQQSLEKYGIRMIHYLSGNAYVVIANSSLLRLLPIGNIRSIIPMAAAWKIDKRVADQRDQAATFTTKLAVAFEKNTPYQEILTILSQHKATILDKKFASLHVYEIALSNHHITVLADEAVVTYITVAATDVNLNSDERAATGASIAQLPASLGGKNLDGTGMVIGLGDNATPLFHADTRDRVTNFNPDRPELHGQHVTGTMAGSGLVNPRGKGMAPQADILAHLYNLVWAQTPFMYQDYGMTLTNNSYAAVVNDCAVAGTYDLYSQMLDDNAIRFPEVLNVFAAGNDGDKNCPPYPFGYGTVVGVYQAAKNILTVSSMRKNYTEHEGASKGPVKDGRIKPEVVSFGADIFSCDLNDAYQSINGTSMACPGATGALALLSQRYKELHSKNPSNALLKALMINGAMDVGNTGPDYMNGFGMIHLERSLSLLENNQYQSNTVSNGISKTISINVPANTAKLKVLLYWNDVPASPAASATLVNNLDVTVAEPNNTVHRPLILDPTPANVTNLATEGIDLLNNVEQVVINNPQAGNYTITVRGTAVPSASQEYFVVYDFEPVGIAIKHPSANVCIPANQPTTVFWDASSDVNTLTLEYSDNNGAMWNVIDNNIAASQKYYTWNVPNLNTTQALIRLKRNNSSQQAITGQFIVNEQPSLQSDTLQCPGYFGFSWNPISNAGAYQVLRKSGKYMQPIDTITATHYLLSGLPLDQMQYVAVAPILNGKAGYRSTALRRLPNDGSCQGTIPDNDLMVEDVVSPVAGRKFTPTELLPNQTLTVRVRNLDDIPYLNYRISYSINGSGWISSIPGITLPPNSFTDIPITGVALSAVGVYQVRIAVGNLSVADPVKSNDTITVLIKQLANDPVDISNMYTEDFESLGKTAQMQDEWGVLNEHWDYANTTDSGRLRSFVSSDVLIGGQRSLSMDLLYNLPETQNYLYGTFNLSNFDVATAEARFEFDYKVHGTPKSQDGNDVFIRGSYTQPWVKLFSIDTSVAKGVSTHSSSLSLTHTLALAGQNFSSSFQLRIGQHDTSAIAMNDYGNGLTIDNLKLYTVKNDVQLLRVVSPVKSNCRLSTAEPVSVLVYNSDNLGQANIMLSYRFDNGTIITQQLDTLPPKDTLLFTFQQPINASVTGFHTLDVWLVAQGDTYTSNDSILQYRFRNQPVINHYPYLENFESTDGNWYAEGINQTWQYGKPESPSINRAASGFKAWKTNLSGKHNDNETGYLYSPCFDISGLANPMLSFSLATDIENCGADICDRAYLEYSEDGIVWTKLGTTGSGFNWYNSPSQLWNEQGNTRWRVASQILPQSSRLKLRFVFMSDAGAAREGIAIDDIHIFDMAYPIADAGNFSIKGNGNPVQEFTLDNKIFTQVFADNQEPGQANLEVHAHGQTYNSFIRQYYLSRNYALEMPQTPQGSTRVRLYVTDQEFLQFLADHSCTECTKPLDIYRLGVLQYDDANLANENGSWLDNQTGSYHFIPYEAVIWVPYDKGYYAELSVTSFSEFWFTTGIPDKPLSGLFVYPNPVTGNRLYIAWHSTASDKLEITLYDAIGKLVHKAEVTATDADNLTQLALPQLASGTYLLRYKTATRSGQTKLSVK